MAPKNSADSTRERILAAAKTEFADHGIAGARVDRIAKEARTSKERVYAYFTSKESLYRLVTAQELAAAAEAARLDAADLPGYAGRIHDYFTAHPECYRLMIWGRLELRAENAAADDPVRDSVTGKIEKLRRAQEAGLLDTTWEPIDILIMLNQIAVSWVDQADHAPAGPAERAAFMSDRRAAVVAAVERLFPAATSG